VDRALSPNPSGLRRSDAHEEPRARTGSTQSKAIHSSAHTIRDCSSRKSDADPPTVDRWEGPRVGADPEGGLGNRGRRPRAAGSGQVTTGRGEVNRAGTRRAQDWRRSRAAPTTAQRLRVTNVESSSSMAYPSGTRSSTNGRCTRAATARRARASESRRLSAITHRSWLYKHRRRPARP